MKAILQQGLHPPQLEQLIQLCESNFDSDPIAFFILDVIFTRILHDFWEIGQVPKEDYNRLVESLLPLIIEVWESSGDNRRNALERLIKAHEEMNTPAPYHKDDM